MSEPDDESNAVDALSGNDVQRERQWYGSLDGQMKNVDSPKESKSDSPSPISLENIHTSNEYMELEEPEVSDDKAALLQEFERKRRARMITVPTDDSEVKATLRQHCEPICLFGEGPADRRNRLKDFLSRKDDPSKASNQEVGQGEIDFDSKTQDSFTAPIKEETWYHRGPTTLKEARMFIVNYSVPRARGRIKSELLEKETPDTTRKARKQETQSKLRSFSLIGSQNADARPISYCSFNPNGKMIATSSWSGLAKVWQTSDCKELLTFKSPSSSYVDCIEWHPGSGVCLDNSTVNLVSSFRDGRIFLWSLNNSDPLDEIPKMDSRVSRVKFHPSGRFIGACVHDNSWRLWDLQAREEVLFQEGHSKAVFTIGFQKDGALCATGGMDCFGRVWDLRTGRCVMFLSGHIGSVLSLDWSPNCYLLATGSDDNTVRIWDVRARKCMYTIPAHSSLVSSVAYDPHAGQYLATCSYDGSLKLWCHGSFQLIKSLEGHGQKVMGTDISPDGNLIVSSSFDRTFKLWGPD